MSTADMRKTPSALKWLAEARGRSAGDLERLERLARETEARMEEGRKDLAAYDRTIKAFDAAIDPTEIEPVYAWKGKYGQRGALRSLVLSIVEQSGADGIESRCVAALVIAEFGLEFPLPQLRTTWLENTLRPVLK